MRYIIFGAGAIGGAIGGSLFQHGHDVVLVARGAHYEAMRDRGLELISPSVSPSVSPSEASGPGGAARLAVPVTDHIAGAAPQAGDIVILTMKSQDTAAALADLSVVADLETVVVCGQNGVDNERKALRRFRRVYGMCVMLPATFLKPGVVHVGWAPMAGILDVGRYPLGTDDSAEQIARDLEASTFLSRAEPLIMRRKYAKLLLNLDNALDAAAGPAGRASELYGRAKAEGVKCLRAAGIDYASDEEDQARRADLRRRNSGEGGRGPRAGRPSGPLPSSPSGWSGSSSWQSLARGTGTIEADYLNGEIVLLGRQHGVVTPVNELLQRVANRMARDHVGPGSYTVEDLMAEL